MKGGAKLVLLFVLGAAAVAVALLTRPPARPSPPMTSASAQLPSGPAAPAPSASAAPCCPSGGDCGPRGCDALLEHGARFTLRGERAPARRDAAPAPTLKLCIPASATKPKRCTTLPNSDIDAGLAVEVAELATSGVELTFELPVATSTGVFRKPVVFSETIRWNELTGNALCRGLSPKLEKIPLSGLTLYLDPPTGPRPRRCDSD